MLSIITITFNNFNGLKNTISSINYELDIEHIIIDGASSDETPAFLQSIDIPNLSWLSEPDQGIYDAMNKGLSRATGDYVLFMNAGDQFYSHDSLRSIIDLLTMDQPDVFYSDTMYIDAKGQSLGLRSQITTRPLPDQLTWQSMRYGMLVCHQSFIVKKSLAPPYILGNLSADIDWQIRCLKKAKNIHRSPKIIARYLIGGTSQQQKIKSLTDRFSVMLRHYGWLTTLAMHVYFVFRSLAFKLNSILFSKTYL